MSVMEFFRQFRDLRYRIIARKALTVLPEECGILHPGTGKHATSIHINTKAAMISYVVRRFEDKRLILLDLYRKAKEKGK